MESNKILGLLLEVHAYMEVLYCIHIQVENNRLVILDGTKFQGNLGGARIGIVAKPSAEFVAGILGTWFSGGVAVPLALSYPEPELLHVINNSVCSENPPFFICTPFHLFV